MDRESYSLAAGLSLGMITLGCGSDLPGMTDLDLVDQLYHYINGGIKKVCLCIFVVCPMRSVLIGVSLSKPQTSKSPT